MRGQSALRIEAFGLHKDICAREVGAAFDEAGQCGIIEMFPCNQGEGQALADVVFDAMARAGARKLQGGGEAVEFGLHGVDGIAPATGAAQLFDVDGQAIVGLVVGEQAAMAVQNAAARTGEQHAPHALSRLPLLKRGRLHHLQAVQSGTQQDQPGQEEESQQGDAPVGERLWFVEVHGRETED